MERMPHPDEVARLHELMQQARFKAHVEESSRLAHLPYQDSYSFELGELYLGAPGRDELLRYYENARWAPPDPLPAPSARVGVRFRNELP